MAASFRRYTMSEYSLRISSQQCANLLFNFVTDISVHHRLCDHSHESNVPSRNNLT